MSDPSDPSAPAAAIDAVVSPAPAGDLEVDLTAFLPEGTELAPSPAAEPAVDLEVLTSLEADLTAVDEALLALDAGEPSRSPLLTELLAVPAPPTI